MKGLEKHGLVIDSESLSNVYNLKLEKRLRDLAIQFDSVLCCRLSPGQKAQVT